MCQGSSTKLDSNGAICMFLHLERGVCGARYVGEPNWFLRLVGVGDVESARVQRIMWPSSKRQSRQVFGGSQVQTV